MRLGRNIEMKKLKSYTFKRLEVWGDPVPRMDKKFRLFVVIVLLGFGVYQSCLYFGHQEVPFCDFHSFIITGREILSFELPSDFTRVPVLGILIVGLSHLIGGSYPEVTAGWLLNAILHPFNLLLLWLVGREIIGNSALWIALIAILNPWVVQLLIDPIAETTFLFFILLTFYFIFRRSRWSYLFASITSMVRYEGAVLILAAFVIDLMIRKTRRERFLTFLYAFLSILPLCLWLLGSLGSRMGIYYLRTINQDQYPISRVIHQIWGVTFSSLLRAVPPLVKWSILITANKVIASIGIVFGIIYGLSLRRWKVIALLIFLTGYFLIHLFTIPVSRYWIPIFWILLLIWWYGWQSFWRSINRNKWIPDSLAAAVTVVIPVLAGLWLIFFLVDLSGINPPGKNSVSLPYAAMVVIGILYAGRLFFYRARYWSRDIAVSVVVCLVLVSNQYRLVGQIGDGQRDIEFKYLAEWYRDNAGSNEKMACTMIPHLKVFAPEYEGNFFPLRNIRSKNPRDFIRECRRIGITYITWDSRLTSDLKLQKNWDIENIALLSSPRSIGPCEFITRIINESDPNMYVNIFRLRP